MIRKIFSSLSLSLFIIVESTSQEVLKYQLPPDDIVRIVDAPQAPAISLSPDKETLILMERPALISIKELSSEELRLGGIRINPMTNGRSRQTFNGDFAALIIATGQTVKIENIPDDPRMGDPVWSPDGMRFAFTNTTDTGTELWICDISSFKAFRVDEGLNTLFGSTLSWLPDNSGLIYRVFNKDRGKRPERSHIPDGPVIQENLGARGQAPTYQDLLKDPVDELLFEYYGESQLMLWDGSKCTAIGKKGIITDFSLSPDGNYILATIVRRPFSYIVPYYNFPSSVQILDLKGNMIRTLFELPLREDEPRGYDVVRTGPRYYDWRSDKPATIYWIEALDGGDYHKNKMQYHDQVFILSAPFTAFPEKLTATEMRFSGITWGREDLAVITEGLSKTRIRRISFFNPSDPQEEKKKIHEYNTDDGYNNPGRFVTELNKSGKAVLFFSDRGRSLYLTGNGASPEGDKPFIDKYDIITGKSTRLWQSAPPFYETISSILDITKGYLLTNRQSLKDPPNYFIRNLKTGKLNQLTFYENPYPQLSGMHKELVRYKRNDGLDLSFTLYLPPGYDRKRDGPLPTLLWAYPREYNDPSTAGQVSGSPYTFPRISPSSALVYITQGYAVLMDASFPIVGSGGAEPNDSFIGQLTANAEAAIEKAVEMGVTDRHRVAVSGHSYGAFMTANLLANTRLFAAGIAESGAYNRTLTPFGFQNERRSYWEAPDVYHRMSPFMHADKVKDPIMLIHGMADNNSGTFPIQSERFYSALKGFGAIVRLVMLPNESHGYAARETILHKHWEVLNWLNRYVRDKKEINQ